MKLAVLGLVLQRPSWGYELVARFERELGHLPGAEWNITGAAIYKALVELETASLVEPMETSEPVPIDARQRSSRKLYRGSAEGARAIREWLAQPMPTNASREEFLLRIRFGGANDRALRELLKQHATACLTDLERLARFPAEGRVERLVREERRLAVQARLSWIDFALAELREPTEGPIRPAGDSR